MHRNKHYQELANVICYFDSSVLCQCSNRMGKLRLSAQRKNERRKKYGFFPVHIPLRNDISFLTVRVPLDGLSYKTSLPLATFHNAPASTLAALQGRIKAAGVIPEGT